MGEASKRGSYTQRVFEGIEKRRLESAALMASLGIKSIYSQE